MSSHLPGLDVEVYADQYAEWLEEILTEQHQTLEDGAEYRAWATWADREAARLDEAQPAHVLKLEWPVIHGGGDAA
jgi:tagatose-1,6-bisphosphate aldolase